MKPGATTRPVTSRTVSTSLVVDRRRGRRPRGSGRRGRRHRRGGPGSRSRRPGSRPGATGRMPSCCDGDTFRPVTSPKRRRRASTFERGRTIAPEKDGRMTVEALRRRRPETLADLLSSVRAGAPGGRLPDPARPGRGRGRGHRDAPDGLRARRRRSATSAHSGRGSCASRPTRRSGTRRKTGPPHPARPDAR